MVDITAEMCAEEQSCAGSSLSLRPAALPLRRSCLLTQRGHMAS